jgi:hypothetical protein
MNCAAISQGIAIIASFLSCHRIQKTDTVRWRMKIRRTHKANGDPITDCRSESKLERSKSTYSSQNEKNSEKDGLLARKHPSPGNGETVRIRNGTDKMKKHQTFGIPLLKWCNQNSLQNLTWMTSSQFAEHALGISDYKAGIEVRNRIWFTFI